MIYLQYLTTNDFNEMTFISIIFISNINSAVSVHVNNDVIKQNACCDVETVDQKEAHGSHSCVHGLSGASSCALLVLELINHRYITNSLTNQPTTLVE